jgi:CBS domain-containing protein
MAAQANSLIQNATAEFLRRHTPFSQMESAAVDFIAQRATMRYFPRDSVILAFGESLPPYCFIIQRGKVGARARNLAGVPDEALTLGAGECFPIGAATARRSITHHYTAIEDTFCYALTLDDFHSLLQQSEPFRLFCTRYLDTLLQQSRAQLQTQMSIHAAEQQTLAMPLSRLQKRAPVACAPDTPLSDVLARMHALRIGSMVVVDGEQKPVGIFTQTDLLRHVASKNFSVEAPMAQEMTPQPHVLPASATGYDAALAMAKFGIRHIVLVDDSGQLAGVVSERDLFTLQRVGLREIHDAIGSARDLAELTHISADIRQLALNLLAQGVAADALTQFISALNDALTRRIIEIRIRSQLIDYIDFSWMAFGSEGRNEQTIATDQDNGIIFVVPEDGDVETARQRLLVFAQHVNRDLDACGFPLCKGNIMAGNPEWCLSETEWRQKFSAWLESPQPKALLHASIFFDFRFISGSAKLVENLHTWLAPRAKAGKIFLHWMANNALQSTPPLGIVRDFVVAEAGEFVGCIDLKTAGARLFVDAGRVYALSTGTSQSNTAERLRRAGTILKIPVDETEAVVSAFHFIQLLRLRQQYLSPQRKYPASNYLNPDELNELDRRILKESFRQARKLQARLKLDYP